MNTIEAIHDRRSIRAYRADPVDRAALEQVVWAAARAPTPPVSGDRPWVFCIFEGIDDLGVRAGQRAMLSTCHLGLGSCWVGAPIPWLRSEGVAEELGLPPGFEPAVAVVPGRISEGQSAPDAAACLVRLR